MPLNLNNYKNIIFDFGGVIINIDYKLTAAAFQNMGLSNFDELFSKAKQNQLFDLYEKGLITSHEFRTELRSAFNMKPTAELVTNAWNAMLLDLPRERLDFLEKLKSTHRTFLLSNTNELHIDAIFHALEKDMAIPDLSVYFEKMYLSYKVKMRKPDAEIFQLVLRENRLQAKETLFIDDSPQHIEAAKRLGIQTYLLDVEKESILDIFS
ncbi:MAG: HAD-superfamily hydrolase, subfamily variant 3 [Bacteroidetes bacterium]|jgi:epoxide hydrolase-like predicted phosphatase|nr:HAD-superfamily hydrolase, subfamily variant 3 [Bacteroidota bacterium]